MKKKRFIRFFRSLRLYVFILVIAAGMIPLSLVQTVFSNSIKSTMISSRETSIKKKALIMANQIVKAGYLYSSTQSSTLEGQLSQLASDFDGRIMVVDTSGMVICDTLDVNTGRFLTDENVLMAFNGTTYSNTDLEKNAIVFVSPVSGSEGQVLGVMVFDVDISQLAQQIKTAQNKLSLLLAMIAAVIILMAFATAYFAAAPFAHLKEAVTQLRTGAVTELKYDGYSELTDTVDDLNSMLVQLHKLDESRQEFVSNVSHELKTPITSMRVLADSIMTMEDAPVELYKEFMQDISSEVDREAKIISDLLALVRMEKTAAALDIKTVDVNKLINDVLHRLLPIAQQRNIELVMESFRPVSAEVDETKLSLAVSNLVENAVKYNVDGGFVHVSMNADHKYMYIKVQDSGVGIPEDCQELIFERFYRVDKARSRETGGTGLGLAITKSVIQMHNGDIRVYSRMGEGTTFSVRIPLKYRE